MEKTQWEEAIRCGAVGCFAIQHYNTLLLGEGCEEEEKRKKSVFFAIFDPLWSKMGQKWLTNFLVKDQTFYLFSSSSHPSLGEMIRW